MQIIKLWGKIRLIRKNIVRRVKRAFKRSKQPDTRRIKICEK